MIQTSFQDFNLREKQISQSFSHCELINSLKNGTNIVLYIVYKKIRKCQRNLFFVKPEVLKIMMSQSFPVSCFWSCGLPHRKLNLTLLVHQNTGKENRNRKNVFAILIIALGRFDQVNIKKNLSYTL